jgi:hypothetical protein
LVRFALRAVLVLAALAGLLVAAALVTARPADPKLYPATAAGGGAEVYVVYGRWTASLVAPTQALAPGASGPPWTRISCDLRRPSAFALLPGDQPLRGEVGAVRLTLSAPGMSALAKRLETSFGPKQTRIAPNVYASPERLLKLRLCGPWLGGLLNAAGVPTLPVLDAAPAGLAQDLVWRAGAVELDRPSRPR